MSLGLLGVSLPGCNSSSEANGPPKKSRAEEMAENARPPLDERNRIDELEIELEADVRTNTQGWPTDINLSGTEFGDDRSYLLSGWKDLEVLNLADAHITDKSLEALADNTKLKQVILARTQIGNDGLAYLTKNSGIYWLDLSRTNVTDAGLEHVSKLNNLIRLDLTGTKVTARGILAHLRSMGKLQKILLAPGQFSDAQMHELNQYMGDTNLFD
ncbi:MAG: hypothetical protein KDA42_03430 [Planctomycetales bacterium]|nr:hypothetical protein [Planctomycetales bacterium]